MTEIIELIKDWFFGLGDKYNVNPIIFGSIYVGAIPFFTASMAWLINNYKKDKPILLPAMSSTACFISAYIYLIIVGNNVPWWIYGVVVLMVGYGSWSTYRKIRRKINKIDRGIPANEQV